MVPRFLLTNERRHSAVSETDVDFGAKPAPYGLHWTSGASQCSVGRPVRRDVFAYKSADGDLRDGTMGDSC